MIKENQRFLNNINIISDIGILCFSVVFAYFLRFYLLPNGNDSIGIKGYAIYVLTILPVYFFNFSLFNLYGSFRKNKFLKEMKSIIYSNFIIFALSLAFFYIYKIIDVSRLLILIAISINTILTIFKRFFLRKSLVALRKSGYNQKTIIIFGAGKSAIEVLKTIRMNRQFGYKYIGYISNNIKFSGSKLGNFSDTHSILSKYKPDELICALELNEASYLHTITEICESTGTKISIVPFCYEYISSKPSIDQFGNIPIINMRDVPLDNMGNAILKRFVDIVGSVILLLFTSPIMLITTIIIKSTSNGPVIFNQIRVGRNKEEFTMYKFRSMIVNNEHNIAWSKQFDDRKTKFGSFIRKFSIDELPQFFNVLKGDMSLVGPRPEIPHFVNQFKDKIPRYMVKHQVKPGITGLAQIKGYRGDTSIKKRIECDIEYIENWTIFLDIKILFLTVLKGFKNNERLVKNDNKVRSDGFEQAKEKEKTQSIE